MAYLQAPIARPRSCTISWPHTTCSTLSPDRDGDRQRPVVANRRLVVLLFVAIRPSPADPARNSRTRADPIALLRGRHGRLRSALIDREQGRQLAGVRTSRRRRVGRVGFRGPRRNREQERRHRTERHRSVVPHRDHAPRPAAPKRALSRGVYISPERHALLQFVCGSRRFQHRSVSSGAPAVRYGCAACEKSPRRSSAAPGGRPETRAFVKIRKVTYRRSVAQDTTHDDHTFQGFPIRR